MSDTGTREEFVERLMKLLFDVSVVGESSSEIEQLWQLLIDHPKSETPGQLRTLLADPFRPTEYRTPEIENVALRLDAVAALVPANDRSSGIGTTEGEHDE